MLLGVFWSFLFLRFVNADPVEGLGSYSSEVAAQIKEAEAKGSMESRALYRNRLLKLRTLLRDQESLYLKAGIEAGEAECANGDLALLEAFEWVDIRKLKKARDCEDALKTLRALEDPQNKGPELRNVEHQLMARLIRPLCLAVNQR